MWSSEYSIGQKVVRVSDGLAGTVAEIEAMGSIGVRWDSSGVMAMVVPSLLRPA